MKVTNNELKYTQNIKYDSTLNTPEATDLTGDKRILLTDQSTGIIEYTTPQSLVQQTTNTQADVTIAQFINETDTFTVPANSNKKIYECSFGVDKNIIIDNTALSNNGEVMYFEQMDIGKISFIASGISIRLGLTQSLSTVGIGDKVAIIRKTLNEYIIY